MLNLPGGIIQDFSIVLNTIEISDYSGFPEKCSPDKKDFHFAPGCSSSPTLKNAERNQGIPPKGIYKDRGID
jgi:hypothetical protein